MLRAIWNFHSLRLPIFPRMQMNLVLKCYCIKIKEPIRYGWSNYWSYAVPNECCALRKLEYSPMPWTCVIQNILFSCISRAKVRCHTEADRYCNSTVLNNGNNWSCGFVLCSYMDSNVISDSVTSVPAPLMNKNPQRCKINHCLIGHNTVESPKIFQGLI